MSGLCLVRVTSCPGCVCPGYIGLGISQLLLTRFWWNFKGSILGTSMSISGISQLLITQFWPNLKGRLKFFFNFLFREPDHFTQNLCTQRFLNTKFFWIKFFFWANVFLVVFDTIEINLVFSHTCIGCDDGSLVISTFKNHLRILRGWNHNDIRIRLRLCWVVTKYFWL